MFSPRLLTTSIDTKLPDTLTRKYAVVTNGLEKLLLIKWMIETKFNDKRILVFCNTVQSADRLAELMGYKSISSTLDMKQKRKLINQFLSNEFRVLVGTDQLARGMDLTADVVIEFDTARLIETFIHRAGRTARAGKEGTCVSLMKKSQVSAFKKLLKPIGSNNRSMKYDSSILENEELKLDLTSKIEKLENLEKKRKNNTSSNKNFNLF